MADIILRASSETTFICPNCGAATGGMACHACGQKRIKPDELSFKHALHVVFEGLFHLDSKFFSSLKLLFFRPGQLTLDYLEGRRQRHVKPFQLYLCCLAIYFFFSIYGILTLKFMMAPVKQGPLIQMMTEKAKRKGQTLDQFIEAREERFHGAMKFGSMVTDLVVFSFLFFLLFRRRWPYLGQHLIMILHYNSFTYLFGILGLGLTMIPGTSWLLQMIFLFINYLYLYLAARRVYGLPGQHRLRMVFKTGAVFIVSYICLIPIILIAFIIALFT